MSRAWIQKGKDRTNFGQSFNSSSTHHSCRIMGPRRKNADLKLQSIWDETLVEPVLTRDVHRTKVWHHLITSFSVKPPKKRATCLEDIPYSDWNVPKAASEKIQQDFTLFTTKVVEKQDSARGDTTKLLLRLQDGHEIETVIMKHTGHATVCISSQIGCQMGCRYVIFHSMFISLCDLEAF